MREHELRLLWRARKNLGSIQEDVHAIRDQYEAQRQRDDVTPEPLVLRAELQMPERIETANRSKSDREYRVQKLLVVGTWLAFIAAAIYACVAESTRRTMVEANKLTERLVRGTYAASINPDVGFSSDVVTINFTNSGKAFSEHMEVTGEVSRKTIPDYKTSGATAPVSIKRDHVAPFPNPGATVHREYVIPVFSETDRDLIWHAQEAISIEGTFSYGDGFGGKIEGQPFCFLYVMVGHAPEASHPPQSGPPGSAFIPCEAAKNNVRLMSRGPRDSKQ